MAGGRKTYLRRFVSCACGDHAFVGLSQGLIALVSPCDVPKLRDRNWHAFQPNNSGTWYAQSSRGGKHVYMHRVVLDAAAGAVVDHERHNGLDNRRTKIRSCTQTQNNGNRRPEGARKLSRFKGVSKNHGTWRGNLWKDGRRVWSGNFSTQEEAARAYDRALVEHFGEFALTNERMGLYGQ